jgi:septum formation topological specificity factor MinE
MPIDEALLSQLKETKAAIDELQDRLKSIVADLREQGATAQEIAAALRN